MVSRRFSFIFIFCLSVSLALTAVVWAENPPTMVLKWGASGTADGQFKQPHGLATDASGNIYVADTENNRIQKFDSNGIFITKFGTLGTANGQFNGPYGVAVDNSGNIYVADTDNNRIQKFSNAGVYITSWGGYGVADGQFSLPSGIAADASGNIYVADTYNHRIQKFSSEGTFIAKWGTLGTSDNQFDSPLGVKADSSDNIWVSDTRNNRIMKFGNTGNFLYKWGSTGIDNGFFKSPTTITTDTSGNVYVTDKDNNRIQKFSGSGTFMAVWGGYGSTDGLFIQPWGIVTDNAGNIFVADRDNNRIQKFGYPVTGTRIISLSGDMAFGNVNLGTSLQRVLTIRNTGNAALNVYSIAYPPGFSGNWNGTIAAGSMQSVTVNFVPTVSQNYAGMIVVNSDKTSGSETISVSGTGITNSGNISVNRTFSCYLPGNKLIISLAVQTSSSTGNYAVEDRPPSGWTVSNISDNGIYDSINNKVKFGPFFDNSNRTLTYEVTPPLTESGDKTFSGIASADGVNVSIGGGFVIGTCLNHPADISPSDFSLSIGEVTAYGSAWKNGTNWSIPPNPIPVGYVTRAGALWKGGERYRLDLLAGSPPMCWVNTGLAVRDLRSSESVAVRQIPQTYQAGDIVTVVIEVVPAPGVQAYAVEDQPPTGWEVPSVNNNGRFDSTHRKVRFGLFLDNQPRTLSYQVKASSSGAPSFAGVASFNGEDIRIISKRGEATPDIGNINCDDKKDLKDVILVLQVLSGMPVALSCETANDVDNNGKIGMENAIYLLQFVSGIR